MPQASRQWPRALPSELGAGLKDKHGGYLHITNCNVRPKYGYLFTKKCEDLGAM